MEISIKLEGAKLVVAPNGRLDSNTSNEFEEVINKNLTEEVNELTIDFSNIDFISSKGLRVLVGVYKKMEGKSMIILNPNMSVKEVFSLSGLLKVFTINEK